MGLAIRTSMTEINDRYDMLRFFADGSGEVGVAIEMDNWMVHRDLLKFRRGIKRRGKPLLMPGKAGA
jgi:hypothetical protein